jgi:hypothetical protein
MVNNNQSESKNVFQSLYIKEIIGIAIPLEVKVI